MTAAGRITATRITAGTHILVQQLATDTAWSKAGTLSATTRTRPGTTDRGDAIVVVVKVDSVSRERVGRMNRRSSTDVVLVTELGTIRAVPSQTFSLAKEQDIPTETTVDEDAAQQDDERFGAQDVDLEATRPVFVHDLPMGGCSTATAHFAHLDAGDTVCENQRPATKQITLTLVLEVAADVDPLSIDEVRGYVRVSDPAHLSTRLELGSVDRSRPLDSARLVQLEIR